MQTFQQLVARYFLAISAVLQFIPILGAGVSGSYLFAAVCFKNPYDLERQEAWIAAVIWVALGPWVAIVATYLYFFFNDTSKFQGSLPISMLGFLFGNVSYMMCWIPNYAVVLALIKSVEPTLGENAKIYSMYWVLFLGTLLLVGPALGHFTGNLVNWLAGRVPGALGSKWKGAASDKDSILFKSLCLVVEFTQDTASMMPGFAFSNALLGTLQYWAGDDSSKQIEALGYAWLVVLFCMFVGLAAWDMFAEMKEAATKIEVEDKKSEQHKFWIYLLGFWQLNSAYLFGIPLWEVISTPLQDEGDDKELRTLGFIYLALGPLLIAFLQGAGLKETLVKALQFGFVKFPTARAFVWGGGLLWTISDDPSPEAPQLALRMLSFVLFYAITAPLLQKLDKIMNSMLEGAEHAKESESALLEDVETVDAGGSADFALEDGIQELVNV